MHLIGRGRYARETYPGAGQTSALVALSNRYLIAPSGPSIPSNFTVAAPTIHIVAAARVTRRASGIFMLAVQLPSTLNANDEQSWSASLLFGSVPSGGVASGSWLLDMASTITTTSPSDVSVMGVDIFQSDTGNLIQTVSLVGTNSKPAPQGDSTIIIAATTLAGTEIIPGGFFGTAFELP